MMYPPLYLRQRLRGVCHSRGFTCGGPNRSSRASHALIDR